MRLHKGDKIYLNGEPMQVVTAEFVNPGKGQAFTRVVLRNLLRETISRHTFKAKDKIEFATDLEDMLVKFNYQNRGEFFFTKENHVDGSVEEIHVHKQGISPDKGKMLINALDKDIECGLLLRGKDVIYVSLPKHLSFKVEQVVERCGANDRVNQGSQKVQISSGDVIKVPPFIDQGDTIVVDIEELAYVSRRVQGEKQHAS